MSISGDKICTAQNMFTIVCLFSNWKTNLIQVPCKSDRILRFSSQKAYSTGSFHPSFHPSFLPIEALLSLLGLDDHIGIRRGTRERQIRRAQLLPALHQHPQHPPWRRITQIRLRGNTVVVAMAGTTRQSHRWTTWGWILDDFSGCGRAFGESLFSYWQ